MWERARACVRTAGLQASWAWGERWVRGARRTLGLCEVTATVLPAALICLGAFSKLSLFPNCSGAAPASTK